MHCVRLRGDQTGEAHVCRLRYSSSHKCFLLTLTKKIFLVTCRPVKLLHSYNVVDVESIYLLGKQFTLHVGLQTSNHVRITSKILIV